LRLAALILCVFGSIMTGLAQETPVDSLESTPEIVVPVATLTIVPILSFNGRALYQNRLPDHSGIDVTVLDLDGVMVTSTQTDETGSFSLNVPAVPYFWLIFSAPLHQRQAYLMQPDMSMSDVMLLGGDLDADGCINSTDLSQLITYLDTSDDTGTDISGDGMTDVVDLAILTGNFDPTCVSDTENPVEATEEATAEVTIEVTAEATAEVTEEATPELTPEVTPELEMTAEVTVESTAEATAEMTAAATPEVTSEVSPESTIEITPEVTAAVTPEAIPEPEVTEQLSPNEEVTPDVLPMPAISETPTAEVTSEVVPMTEVTPSATPTIVVSTNTPAPMPTATLSPTATDVPTDVPMPEQTEETP
jgi:hypothetical protein